MRDKLRHIHGAIEHMLTDHEQLCRASLPDVAAIGALQLRLSKANRERKALIEQLYAQLESQSEPARDAVAQLKGDDRQVRAYASRIIGDWPKERILREWADYQKEGIAIRRWNRQRLALEQKLLYPLLAPAGR